MSHRIILIAALLLVPLAETAVTAPSSIHSGQLTNTSYRLEPLATGVVRVHAGPIHADFAPV